MILKHAGLPGYDKAEYLAEMQRLIYAELSSKDLVTLRRNKINLGNLIMELSAEIADEIL